MISNHLSMIEQLHSASEELAAAVDQHLGAGGKIEMAEPYHHKPKPITYSNHMLPAMKPFVRRRVEPMAPSPPTALEIYQEQRRKRVELVMRLAPTYTWSEVIVATDIGPRTLLSMPKDFGFSFNDPRTAASAAPSAQKQWRSAKSCWSSGSRLTKNLE